MENASKALIMAGGMLLAILIISLLVYAWSLFSKYQSSQDDLADIEDTAKFNEQFTNYDRNGVQGYELLSLVNKVIDYNYRKSNDELAKSDDKYKPVTVVINLVNETYRKKLTQDDGEIQLFTSNSYTQSTTKNTFKKIIDFATEIETRYGGADSATRLAKSIDSIFLSDSQIAENNNLGLNETGSWDNAIKKFNSYSTGITVSSKEKLLDEKERIYKYYEYMQFKRAKFNSVPSKVTYDEVTGRITNMEFDFTGEIE